MKGFAIAGDVKKFYWTKATIIGNTVSVYSDKVPNPVAVRYARVNNPNGDNLYNAEKSVCSSFPYRYLGWSDKRKKIGINKIVF